MRTRPADVISEDDEPLDEYLDTIVERTIERRAEVDRSINQVLHYLEPGDERQVRMCRLGLGRFPGEAPGLDELRSLRCKNPWCPWCNITDHYVLANYIARRFTSVQPDEDEPRIIHLVFEPPAFLHPHIRKDDRYFAAMMSAAKQTIAEAWGYRATHGSTIQRACWSEMGAIANFHAIGDKGRPWPKWFPHIDMLLASVLRKEDRVEPITKTTWPEPYWRTRQRWEDNLRRYCLPLAKKPTLNERLVEELEAAFRAIFHCAETKERTIIHQEDAFRRILYSCRPLVQLHRARIEKEGGRDVLVYSPPPHHGKPILHRLPPGPAMAAAKNLHPWIFGKKRRRNFGFFHRDHYAKTAQLAGKTPIASRTEKGRKMKAVYIPARGGGYERIEPRDIRRHL